MSLPADFVVGADVAVDLDFVRAPCESPMTDDLYEYAMETSVRRFQDDSKRVQIVNMCRVSMQPLDQLTVDLDKMMQDVIQGKLQ